MSENENSYYHIVSFGLYPVEDFQPIYYKEYIHSYFIEKE